MNAKGHAEQARQLASAAWHDIQDIRGRMPFLNPTPNHADNIERIAAQAQARLLELRDEITRLRDALPNDPDPDAP